MHSELATKLGSAVAGCNATANAPEAGDHSITVASDHILQVCEALKAEGFNVLKVISGVDYPPTIDEESGKETEAGHIEVNYILC